MAVHRVAQQEADTDSDESHAVRNSAPSCAAARLASCAMMASPVSAARGSLVVRKKETPVIEQLGTAVWDG
jgi:hypothetical protein